MGFGIDLGGLIVKVINLSVMRLGVVWKVRLRAPIYCDVVASAPRNTDCDNRQNANCCDLQAI